MKGYIYIVLSIILIGCNPNKKIGNGILITHQKVDIQNDFIGKSGPIVFVDNKIIGIDYMLDSCFFYIDTKSDSLFRFGIRGQGPKEFIYPYTLQTIDEHHFCTYDLNSRAVIQFEVNGHINMQEKRIVSKNVMSFDYKKIDQNSYLGFGPYKEGMFVISDSLGRVKESFFEYPYKDKDEKSIKNYLRSMAYQGIVNFNPAGNKFVYTPTWADIIHLYKISNDSIEVITKIENTYPIYKVEESNGGFAAPLRRSNIANYISSAVTNNYIYLLYSGSKLEDYIKTKKEFQGNTVYVYDWTGEKINTLTLDIPCKSICVSLNDKTLWAIAENPEPELVQFEIPEF